MLNLSSAEKKCYLKHMGHSEEMSDNVYQNPPGYLELARVTPILCAAEKGIVKDTMTISQISSKLQGNTSYICSTNLTTRNGSITCQQYRQLLT